MENASKALEMAAGVMLGVLIMSLIAYFFTSISSWPEQQDNEKEMEQTAKFNLEYEVYDKKGMYGADVISCLSKAINNNEKYYEGGSFLSGQKYGEKYWINVYVNLNSCLKEEIYVYYYSKGLGSSAADSGIYTQEQRFSNPVDKNNNEINLNLDIFGFSFEGYTDFRNTDKFNYDERKGKTLVRVLDPTKTGLNISANQLINASASASTITDEETGLKYNAWLYEKKADGSVDTNAANKTPLQTLIKTANTNLKEIVTNNSNEKESLEIWSSAEWRTALYDFKTRKFRCDNIKYSEITGRVNEIYFSEI